MQVSNSIIEKILPILLWANEVSDGVNWPEAIDCRDELIRCQERDKLQVRAKQDSDIELHENIYILAGLFTDWLNADNDVESRFAGGTGQAMGDIIEWAREFTEKNKDRQWDGEWYDELEEFFGQKINSL